MTQRQIGGSIYWKYTKKSYIESFSIEKIDFIIKDSNYLPNNICIYHDNISNSFPDEIADAEIQQVTAILQWLI